MKDSMDTPKWRKWLKQVRETQAEEISCSDCFDQVSAYVDLELAGEPAEALLPQLKHHLDQCQICRQEYELLRELAQAESEDSIPSIDELRRSISGDESGT